MNGVDFILSTDSFGGAELYTLELARACAADVDVRVFVSPNGEVIHRAEDLGLAVVPIGLGPKLGRATAARNTLRLAKARGTLRMRIDASSTAGRFTILQFKWEELLWAGEVAANHVGLIEHGPIPQALLRIPWSRRRLVRAFSAATTVWAVSDPADRAIVSLCDRKPSRLDGGVDPVRVEKARQEATSVRRDVLADAPLLVVFVGRFTRGKGVHEVLNFVETFPDVVAALIGDGPERASLERRANRNERVLITGSIRDPLPYLAAADATLLLTTEAGEGRPLAALESLAVGTPVVALSATDALRALALEFGWPNVILIDRALPAAVRSAVTAACGTSVDVDVPSWSDVASSFLETLNARGVARVTG